MSCQNVQQLISPLLDHRLAGEEREAVLQHLVDCRECNSRAELLAEMRMALRRMQQSPLPQRLATQLRISASKERVRLLSRRTFREWAACWASGLRITLDNLMRPLAVPFAGGVFSAFVIFGTLMPTLATQRITGLDVPIALFTDPTLEEVGHSHTSIDDTILELTVDERGRVSDYSNLEGKLTPEMQNDLLFYRFAPATAFGQPTWGKVTVTFRRSNGGSHIVVRG